MIIIIGSIYFIILVLYIKKVFPNSVFPAVVVYLSSELNKMLKSRFLATCLFTLFLISFVAAQLEDLDDEFDRPCSLSEWNNITQFEGWGLAEHLEAYDISTTIPGHLMMMPYTSSWFEDYRGTLIFKELSGNFVFTSRVTATNRIGQAVLPNSLFSLAGMMVRKSTGRVNGLADWAPDQENYVFLSIGRADGNSTFQFEVKTTEGGTSILNISPISSNTAFIRMVRVDNAILVLYQVGNDPWVVHRRYDRNDLIGDVQLGFVTYTDWDFVNDYAPSVQNSNVLNDAFENRDWSPDLIGSFDFARFQNVDLPQNYIGLDMSDAGIVSDQEILNLFGYPSLPSNPSNAKVWQGTVDNDWGNGLNWLNGTAPSAGDQIIIPDCGCSSVHPPSLSVVASSISSLILETGASLTVPVGGSLTIDLAGANSEFLNSGTIDNYGTITILNAQGKMVINEHNIINRSSSNLVIEN